MNSFCALLAMVTAVRGVLTVSSAGGCTSLKFAFV